MTMTTTVAEAEEAAREGPCEGKDVVGTDGWAVISRKAVMTSG